MNLRKILFHLIPHINVCWWMLASTTNQSLMFVGWSCNCLHNKSGIFVIDCATVNDRSSWSLMTYCYDCQWLAAPWSTTINGRLLVIVDNCCQPVDHAHWTLVTFPLSPFSFFNFPFFLLIPLDFSFLSPPSFGKKKKNKWNATLIMLAIDCLMFFFAPPDVGYWQLIFFPFFFFSLSSSFSHTKKKLID